MTSSKLKILVISDLHCKHTSSDLDKDQMRSLNSTILYSDLLRRDVPPKHPVYSLLQQIEKDKLKFKSDILICPGDITDKLDHQGYITGWSFLEEIKEKSEAEKLYATIGNHDVDSRRNDKDLLPFTVAKAIKYNYPISDQNALVNFWNDQFCIIEDKKYILLIFNSSYSHISSMDAQKSCIGKDIIGKMNDKLKGLGKDKIKIALCHHHPIGQSNSSEPDLDLIENGVDFLDMLSNNNFAIIIHGHKHEVKIRYYQSIVVFCSGSFSSTQNIKETESDNVFHVIDFTDLKSGIINTWYYGSHNGWHRKAAKFPPLTGFGFQGNIEDLAFEVSDWFKNKSNNSNDLYRNLIEAIPNFQYLMPYQKEQITDILINKYEIDITYDKEGLPKYISKIIN